MASAHEGVGQLSEGFLGGRRVRLGSDVTSENMQLITIKKRQKFVLSRSLRLSLCLPATCASSA